MTNLFYCYVFITKKRYYIKYICIISAFLIQTYTCLRLSNRRITE